MSTADGATARVLRQFDPAAAPGRDERRPPQEAQRPRLRVVRAPDAARSRVPFALLCGGIIVFALVAALLLNVQMARGSFATQNLETQLAQTAQDTQKLQAQVDAASAPAALAKRAAGLGMVPRESQAFLRLPDGKILGDPQPAGK